MTEGDTTTRTSRKARKTSIWTALALLAMAAALFAGGMFMAKDWLADRAKTKPKKADKTTLMTPAKGGSAPQWYDVRTAKAVGYRRTIYGPTL